jgi:hypothetical protein
MTVALDQKKEQPARALKPVRHGIPVSEGLDKRTRLERALAALPRKKQIISLPKIRKKLGGINDASLVNLMQFHGMPSPMEHRTISRGQFIRSYSWDKDEWTRWYKSSRTWISDIKNSGWEGNVRAYSQYVSPHYGRVTRDWIHQEALKLGRVLTHEITIGFKEPKNPFHDPKWLSRKNEDDLDIVGPLTKKMPTKVWRRFINVCRAPDDIFLFCIYPENHTRYGHECRWHFHIELFLTEYEGKLLKIAMPRIRKKLEAYLDKYAGGRKVDVQMQPVDFGFAGYAQKDAFHNLQMIECNFLNATKHQV